MNYKEISKLFINRVKTMELIDKMENRKHLETKIYKNESEKFYTYAFLKMESPRRVIPGVEYLINQRFSTSYELKMYKTSKLAVIIYHVKLVHGDNRDVHLAFIIKKLKSLGANKYDFQRDKDKVKLRIGINEMSTKNITAILDFLDKIEKIVLSNHYYFFKSSDFNKDIIEMMKEDTD